MSRFLRRSQIHASAAETFAWHSNSGAFERLTPPWEHTNVVSRTGGIEDGSNVTLKILGGPLPQYWVVRHQNTIQGCQFQDIQERGPFKSWAHTHRFIPRGDHDCILEDSIEYDFPFGALGRALGESVLQKRLSRLFDYRHRVTQMDLETTAASRSEKRTLNIAVSGSSGLVGSALIPLLTTQGHRVMRLVRGPNAGTENISWDVAAGHIDVARLEGVDAIIHLAGENIAGRWTAEKKRKIRDSRVNGTRLLSNAIKQLKRKPEVLISASAIGIYGNTGTSTVDESGRPADTFLADVCKEWEASTRPAEDAGVRVVHARLGVVLNPAGGALAKMLTPFKLGVGGRIGTGTQYWSWVSTEDVIGALYFAVTHRNVRGAMNVVAPRAATNLEFTKTLGKVLNRPTIFPMPAFAARLALGEMAEELLLASTRVAPTKLLENNYRFRFPELEAALRHLLGRVAPASQDSVPFHPKDAGNPGQI